MLGLFGSKEDEVAEAVRSFTEAAVERYSKLSLEELSTQLAQDLPEELYHIGTDEVRFTHPRATDFLMVMRYSLKTGVGEGQLTVTGQQEFYGFALMTDTNPWCVSAADGPIQPTTKRARALAKTMERKFGIEDMTRELERLNKM